MKCYLFWYILYLLAATLLETYFLMTDVLMEVKCFDVLTEVKVEEALQLHARCVTVGFYNTRKEKYHRRVSSSALCLLYCHYCSAHESDGRYKEVKKPSLNWKIEFAFVCRYPFVCLPFLKSQRHIQPAPSTSAAPFSHSQPQRRNKKWLSLPGNIRLWLQCKLIWKADAHTSCFTHKKLKLIKVTPAEPGAANLVWRLSALLMSRHSLVAFFKFFILSFSEKHDVTV